MKRIPLCMVMVLAIASFANGYITDWNCADDGDGVIVMDPNLIGWTDNGNANYDMSIECSQAVFGAGHIEGDFTADPNDPTVYIYQEVLNDTGYDWTGYSIKIGMNHPFTIVPGSVVPPAGWTYTITPVAPGITPTGLAGHVGTVNFQGGPAIADGETGAFGFKINWLSGSRTFCTEQTPVPEPISLALLALGGLGLIRRK